MKQEYQKEMCRCQMQCQSDREQLLLEIQQVDFLLVDLQLYLDNHPDCAAALKDFNSFSAISGELKERFHCHYGPIINFGYQDSEYPWQWIDEPWPWERARR